MEQYIDQLRDDSIYIKLESDKKFGGAVDINSLIKALHSLNQSYKRFLEIELGKSSDVRTITKTGKKEFIDFIAESELLIVDLDFSSFGAAISPNTVTTAHYSNINNSLQLKKQSFNTYKQDVLNFNYNDNKFIDRITNKYSIEERRDIYKPIIDNLINSSKFKFYYGKDKQKLKKVPSNLKNSVVDKLISKPNVELDTPKDKENVFILYVTTSDEVDLFGKKPKISKLLASSKLDKPIYPHQLNEIKVSNSTLQFKNKLSADVTFEDDMFFMRYPDLNIEVWGDDRKEAEDAFNFALQSIIKNIYYEKDEKLTNRAIQLKKHLSSILKSANNK